jgi:hypothetical protein
MRVLFISLLLLIATYSNAQDLLGYGHSNYAGIAGASYNPASLADNRFSIDILAIGAGIEVGNNYVGVKRSEIRNPNFGSSNLYLKTKDTKKAVFFRNEVLLPGVMFSNKEFGWGIDMKIRSYVNVDGVETELAHFLALELNDSPNFDKALYNRHIGITALSWAEIGGTYAKTIWTGAEHFVAVGARPKLLLGLAAAYVFINDAGYAFRNDSTLDLVRGDFEFGHSDNFTFNGAYQPSWRMGFNPGFGVDFGIVYEYRPDELQEEKKEDKEKQWPGYRTRPKYKYKIGVSITDLGIIHFRNGEFSDHYTADASMWDLDDKTFDLTSPTPLYNTFELRQGGANAGKGLWMRLPLALNVQFDYMIRKDVFVNATAFSALYFRNTDGRKVHELTRLSITPRWERRWFAVWAPVSFSRLGILSLGAGFRVGPFAIGTTDILVWALRRKTVYSADLYFVLKVPLFPTKKGKAKGGDLKKGGKVDECAD